MLYDLIKKKILSQCETEDKKADGFRISHFDWLFSSDIMAVMGLNTIYIVHSTCLSGQSCMAKSEKSSVFIGTNSIGCQWKSVL